ncbi:calsequestrin-1-like [Cynara cardunculus var. scolymus]|uniref:calsequestrin-1-like n=1 Tax=Cynara cardunculus var. scolymus TaxID=59895 RepID=UPI000D62CB3F|nr:calsequestrin-1-like [Cynara cardunculus var. scolymus]
MKAEAISDLEQCAEDISLLLFDLTSCLADDKEGENNQRQKIVMENANNPPDVFDVEPISLIPHAEDAITSNEAEDVTNVEDDDDVVIAPAMHEDLPITSTLSAGDEESDDDEEDDEDLLLPDVGKDLGHDDDDEDEEDDDLQSNTMKDRLWLRKGVSLSESASQWERTTKN